MDSLAYLWMTSLPDIQSTNKSLATLAKFCKLCKDPVAPRYDGCLPKAICLFNFPACLTQDPQACAQLLSPNLVLALDGGLAR